MVTGKRDKRKPRAAKVADVALAPTGLLFDDEPLDAILYGAAGPAPSSASLFDAARPAAERIARAVAEDRIADALQAASGLVGTDALAPAHALLPLLPLLRELIGNVPCPIVDDHGIDYAVLLRPLFELGCRTRDQPLVQRAGWPLYRWLETLGRYAEAREVIGRLLEVARREGKQVDQAMLTNNYGYEYLLEGNWEAAQPYFHRAAQMFERLGADLEVANARANGLTCRFERLDPEAAASLQAELEEVLAALVSRGDWRQRKPLMLLARLAEHEGRLADAIKLAQRAVIAARHTRTRLRQQDQDYLRRLKRQRGGRQ